MLPLPICAMWLYRVAFVMNSNGACHTPAYSNDGKSGRAPHIGYAMAICTTLAPQFVLLPALRATAVHVRR